MLATSPLTRRQRLVLTGVALAGLLGPNGVFVHHLVFRTGELFAALRHPVTLAFVAEAFLVMGLLAWLIARRGERRYGWKAFVAMSLLGGLAFAVPAFVLLDSEHAEG